MNIKGKIKVFKNEYGYSTAISKKDQEGNWESMYLSLQLPKGTELENKSNIDVTNGFLSFYKNKEGIPMVKVVVMEYKTEDNKEFEVSDPSDLPF